MACELKKIWVVCVLLLVLKSCHMVRAKPPCFFIFGDSLNDDGNNNNLDTIARSNYVPYGIDFVNGPTGRFTNNLTMADILTQLLGFNGLIQPFATASGRDVLSGVNYASGAAGIRDETGQQFGGRISFNGQLRNFNTTVSQIANILGSKDSAADYVNKCIFMVGLGSIDYVLNYFMPELYPKNSQFTVEQFTDQLIQQYSEQLRTLHGYGARKVALIGLSPLGCIPFELSREGLTNGGNCSDRINKAAMLFNSKLPSLVDNLNTNLPGAKFIYVNSYHISEEIARNYSSLGFRVTNTGCCGVAPTQILCTPLLSPCQKRNEYVYWDGIHPTTTKN